MTKTKEKSPRFAFKVAANKAGKAFLAAVRKNLNRDHYTVRVCNSGPRPNGAYSTSMANATHHRIYIELNHDMRVAQWDERHAASTALHNEIRELSGKLSDAQIANESLRLDLNHAAAAHETLTIEHDTLKEKHNSLSHRYGEQLTQVAYLEVEHTRLNRIILKELSVNSDMRRYWHNRSVWFYLVCALRAIAGRPNNFQLFQDQPQQPTA